ncbi:hypothetical protein EG327_011111 [Venturia inaequalis]|uniref:Uncharacterized protein n=1 Tax=Venturia inaequalis TaxID=5025 RepID=A0A8H3UE42_VENIN|nr:hypothetical protein EG327_011111 [Venturia inaequalis]
MRRFKHCNNPNLVLPEPAPRTAQGSPPSPPPLPNFVHLGVPKISGMPHLPRTIKRDDPEAIFELIFTDEAVQMITDNTNANLRLLEASQTLDPALEPHRRGGPPTDIIEMRGHIGIRQPVL